MSNVPDVTMDLLLPICLRNVLLIVTRYNDDGVFSELEIEWIHK